jgi:signal transduction histidine kinase
MWELLERWFGGGFMPHGHCYLWTPAMVWAQVLSNAVIGLAYLSISATLVHIVRQVKLPFSWVYIAFGVFILACGLTHFFDVATVWHPIYWADAAVRIVTAVASAGTAALLFPLFPKVIAISKLSELAKERGEKLEIFVRDLSNANEQLRRGQEERALLAAENATLAERARIQEFQERFIAILGHDLRNPLAAIEMGASLLERSATEPKAAKVLTRIHDSTHRMSRMIGQILDLARSRLGGGLEVRPAPIDLCVTLTRIVDELRVAFPERAPTLHCSDPLLGSWDGDRLEQVFSNLVGNAIHHGRTGTPVTVHVRDDGALVVVEIHNEGPPIAEETRAKLFDPFRRGDRESRTTQTSGLGLGLYISHEIVAAHGGSVEVRSTADDGTTFVVKLPRAELQVREDAKRVGADP